MRRMLALLILFLPLLGVHAQASLTLEEVRVQIWPEEDKPSVLVLYDLKAPADASFPLTLEIPLPPQAELNAVAREEGNMLITIEHQLIAGGEAVRFTMTDAAFYRLEYYFPYEKKGAHRHFVYRWPGTYAVRTFLVELKEPLGAQNLVTTPSLTNVTQLRDFTYHSLTFNDLPAGKEIELSVDYDKTSDALNIFSAAPTGQTITPSPWTRWIPLALGISGILLILGGAIYYWRSTVTAQRAMPSTAGSRRRASKKQASSPNLYCRKCGERAYPGDRFCRKCGAHLGEASERAG
ncbi:MAG: zinc ribbon domain-containing protein [Anaerolineales bacterium]